MKSFYRSIIIKSLQRSLIGTIRVQLPDGAIAQCGSQTDTPSIELQILDESFFKDIAYKGAVGLGESYQRGYWKTNDLCGLLRWFLVNHDSIAPKTSPFLAAIAKRVNQAFNALEHYKNRNTKDGSRANIHAHYDLGNAFYREFLDPSMTYSSAYFRKPDDTLETAQEEKYDRLCRKLGIDSTHHILEIGCGWGGFAVYAAKNYDCCVTATTISREQYNKTKQRIIDENLSNRIHLTLTDYRDLEGSFDRIVSIEMLEAVGQEFLGEYFEQVEALLEPNGLAGIQVITCPNPLYKGFSNRVDWIQKHVFPGSHLPSTHALIENAETNGRLDLFHLESFGRHYARTLREWRERFLERWPSILEQGFDDAFKRKWEYYLAYCEAGFAQRHVNVCQLVFGRADETVYRFELEDTCSISESPKELSRYAVS